MAGGAPTYWEKSCPKCGKPSHTHSRIALNKVNPNERKGKEKCAICKSRLSEKNLK